MKSSGIFNFMFKKEQQVEVLINEYLKAFNTTQEKFLEAFRGCLKTPRGETIDFLISQTHKYESKADDIREEIKSLMYSKALIPDSRGDIMGLLESIDQIPHFFEHVLYMIQTQNLHIPDFLIPDVKELIRISIECCELNVKQVTDLMEQKDGIRSLVKTIDTNESHCDHIERTMITKLFDSDLDPFLKLQLKELIVEIGNISDQSDRVSRRINIISMKRRL